jgi:hypothetical protein
MSPFQEFARAFAAMFQFIDHRATGDYEVSVGPRGIPVSADQERQGEVFEDVIVGGLEIVIGKSAENGA